MTDTTTKKLLKVAKHGEGPPTLHLSWAQVPQVRTLLDAQQIRYEVDEFVVSLDGGPQKALIFFNRQTDPTRVQELLDSVP